MKIKHSQSRTIQARQYEPLNILFEIEAECEAKSVEKEMNKLKAIVDAKLAEAVEVAQVSFKSEKETR